MSKASIPVPEKLPAIRDLGLLGVAVLCVGVGVGYTMAVPSLQAGMLRSVVCGPLLACFGLLAWIVPAIITIIGVILTFDKGEIKILGPMAQSAVSSLLLFASDLQCGSIGKFLSKCMTFCFGDFADDVTLALIALLAISMTGVSIPRIIARGAIALWDLRLPHPSAFMAPKMPVVNHSLGVPIAIPVKMRSYASADVVDVEFVESPSHIEQPKPHTHSHYGLPSLSLFNDPPPFRGSIENKEKLIVDTLRSFKVQATVTHKEVGPSVTRYELTPGTGVKVASISNLANDLALALSASSVRIEAPVPGKPVVGIEVPNATPTIVTIKEILRSLPRDGSLAMALGKDITGKPISADLREMPHLLVAGATGAGKSVCLNNIICSILMTCTPDQVQMLMIDPKRVELGVYNGVPHLVRDVITDMQQAAGALREMAAEMDRRYKLFQKSGSRKIEEYNAKCPDQKLPYMIVIVDELADLMTFDKKGKGVEEVLCRIAALARATGIHLVLATQRPSVDVITGLIKANIPSRIAFAVSAQVDSRTILDTGGAECLLGRGDMLFRPMNESKAQRIQGALITGDEITKLVAFWTDYCAPENRVAIDSDPSEALQAIDSMTIDAMRYVTDIGQASTAKLQSKFAIGHPKATRIMQSLEDLGIIGPAVGKRPRTVLIPAEQVDQIIEKRVTECSIA
jgi:DNA segregation ATPase FtsK/SpoIIIE-like protein